MIAIITDRAGTAKQIALSLNMDVTAENEGCMQGHGFVLMWTDGELVTLSSPENYGKTRLGKDDLPFIPETYSLAVCKTKTVKGTVITNKSAAKQLNIIKKAFDECESIIAATDSGEAGELLFRRIYEYLECKKPFRRLWINSLTSKSIREGFDNLTEGALSDNLYAAAACRAKAGCLIHFNASRAFAIATGLVSHPLDREQTPALAILCKRSRERRNFTSARFFEHRISLGKDGLFLSFALPCTMKNRRNAAKIYESLKAAHTAQIIKVESRLRIQPSPTLYNLTALQRDANERYGLSAAQTMGIARKLYEAKLISHPLAESCYIPEDIFKNISGIIRQAAAYCKMKDRLENIDPEKPNRRSAGNADAWGHHALIPTGIYPGYLPKGEKTVYRMIVCRTLEAFAPDCQKEVMRVEAATGNLVFESKQSRIITPGWRAVQNREEDREEDEANDIFPVFTEGETVPISGWNLLTKRTLPPPLYTEAGFLQTMEAAGLGTSATRASVIETLVSCGYIERQGQNLVPTEKGTVVHNHVKNMKIADAGLSGSWEKTLADIGEGKQTAGTFITLIETFTRQVTDEILSLNRTKDFTVRFSD
jgi:DNA topoisomerase-3